MYMYVYMYMYVCRCMCVYVYMCMCLCVCESWHTYIQTMWTRRALLCFNNWSWMYLRYVIMSILYTCIC